MRRPSDNGQRSNHDTDGSAQIRETPQNRDDDYRGDRRDRTGRGVRGGEAVDVGRARHRDRADWPIAAGGCVHAAHAGGDQGRTQRRDPARRESAIRRRLRFRGRFRHDHPTAGGRQTDQHRRTGVRDGRRARAAVPWRPPVLADDRRWRLRRPGRHATGAEPAGTRILRRRGRTAFQLADPRGDPAMAALARPDRRRGHRHIRPEYGGPGRGRTNPHHGGERETRPITGQPGKLYGRHPACAGHVDRHAGGDVQSRRQGAGRAAGQHHRRNDARLGRSGRAEDRRQRASHTAIGAHRLPGPVAGGGFRADGRASHHPERRCLDRGGADRAGDRTDRQRRPRASASCSSSSI